jgi:hypothetical protein
MGFENSTNVMGIERGKCLPLSGGNSSLWLVMADNRVTCTFVCMTTKTVKPAAFFIAYRYTMI